MQIVDIIRKFLRGVVARIAPWLDRVSGGRITPDMITYTGLAMHVPIAFLIAHDSFWWAAVLLFFFGLFDALDGELARYQKKAGNKGMFLDSATDRLKEMLLYSGVAYYFATGGYENWAFLAVVSCGASMTATFVKARGEVAIALQHKITDHHKLNHHFKQTLAPFEVRIGLLLIGLVTDQLLIITAVIAALSLVSVYTLMKAIYKEL